MVSARTIVLGVTADASLMLMQGFPEFLRDSGWKVHVVSSPGPHLDTLEEVDGIHTHGLPMVRRPSPFSDMRALLAWISMLRTTRPTITSVGTPKAGLLGGLAAVFVGVPHRVYLLRGLRLETATGLSRIVLTALERMAMRCATEVIAVSESLRERAIELRLVQAKRIRVLGAGSSNGVDTSAADAVDKQEVERLRHELGLDDGLPVIGFVGRLTRDKGLAVLAEARSRLVDQGIDHHLLVVGGVDEGETSDVVARLRLSGRSPREVGHVSDPRPYFPLMDLLCLPTLREGFPNVVLEAGAASIPTVTTDATGACDSVIDGVTGLLAVAGDPTSLADRIKQLLHASPAARAALGAAARRRIDAQFARPIVWAATESFYRSLSDSDG